MALLDMDESYADRDLNVGFSGGEKKKAEILQMLMLEPRLAILDETDSGLDVNAVRTVSTASASTASSSMARCSSSPTAPAFWNPLPVDAAHVMENGVIVKNGGPELVDTINEKGFTGLQQQ